MDFSTALAELKAGYAVTRSGWNGKGMWLDIQHPDENSKMTLPYIFMRTADGNNVPWLASQSDILATDWFVCEGDNFTLAFSTGRAERDGKNPNYEPEICSDQATPWTPETGDIVVLKSGGADLTVIYACDEMVGVSWFEGSVHHTEEFPLECVVPYDHDQPF
ncbi:MAG: MW1434 family type I TA system toxin [Pseudomonadota bacterium]